MAICGALRSMPVVEHCIGCAENSPNRLQQRQKRQGVFFQADIGSRAVRDRLLSILRRLQPELTQEAIEIHEDSETDGWSVRLYACLEHALQLRGVRMAIEEHNRELFLS